MSTSNATYREELEGVAWEVIANLKGIPDFADARFAIIGGLAVWKYIPRGRTTDVFSSTIPVIALQANTAARMSIS